MAKLRLNKILAQAGLTSRRGADQLILEGRVAVNGAVVREPGTVADPALDRIAVDGRPLPAAETRQYLLLHKPAGAVGTPLEVALLAGGATTSRLRLTFTEGRKHEVKRYCEALGHRVQRLRRVAFGPVGLGALPVGACRPLTTREVAALRAAA